MKTLSQKSARAALGNPETFRGGVYVTTNGTATLHIMTAEERLREHANTYADRVFDAKLKAMQQGGQS